MSKFPYIIILFIALLGFSSCLTNTAEISNSNIIERTSKENSKSSLNPENDLERLLLEKKQELVLLQKSYCHSIEELQKSLLTEIKENIDGESMERESSINFTIIKTQLEQMALNPESKYYKKTMDEILEDFYENFYSESYFFSSNPYQKTTFQYYTATIEKTLERLREEIAFLEKMIESTPK